MTPSYLTLRSGGAPPAGELTMQRCAMPACAASVLVHHIEHRGCRAAWKLQLACTLRVLL